MSFVPHTDQDRQEMLAAIGVERIEDLFAAIPESARYPDLQLPEPLSEMEIMAELRYLAALNSATDPGRSFLGGGAYRHFVPSVVDWVISRSEFLTAYTPYQPEVSQGTLQAIFEYQTMICNLTGMDVSNASHYDGATATAEAALMAMGASRGKRRKLVVAPSVHPEYRQVLRTYTQGMDVEIAGDDTGSEDMRVGRPAVLRGTRLHELIDLVNKETACLIVQTPDFYGNIIDLQDVADQVHAQGALLVVISNPIALGMLRSPGEYGADIALGEGQPLGNSLSFGGPYLGYLAFTDKLVRRSSGRLVGETIDTNGQRGYVLTLSTREQHIRREKASSNICTNQGLNALAAAAYLGAMGKQGLAHVARLCYDKAHYAAQQIGVLDGYTVLNEGPFFHEFVVRCPRQASWVRNDVRRRSGLVAGLPLHTAPVDGGDHWPQMGEERELLVSVTELNSKDTIDELVEQLKEAAQ